MITRIAPLAAAIAAALALNQGSPLQAQTSTYTMNAALANFSGMTANGGTVVVPYTLTSGSAVGGLGSSFNITYTISDLFGSGANAGNNYMWYNPTSNQTATAGAIGNEVNIASLYTNLPGNNDEMITPGEFTQNSATADSFFRGAFAAGNLDKLGTFSVTTSAAPVVAGYSLTGNSVDLFSVFNARSQGPNILDGYWAAPQLAAERLTGGGASSPVTVAHGLTTVYDFSAFNFPESPTDFQVGQNGRGLWAANNGTISFTAVPEPGSALLVMAGAGAFLVLRRRRPTGKQS